MEIEFTTKNPRQIEAAEFWVDDVTEEILYGGAKGGGKSYLGASLIFGDALIYPGTHYFIARKERIDLVNYTTPTIREVFTNWGLKFEDYATFNSQTNCYTLHNGSKVFMIACKREPSDPMFERFGSMQITRGWIEEGGEVEESAKANLWLSIGRWKNEEYKLKKKLLITANPKKGWMKRDFVDLWKQNLLPKNRQFVQAFSTDNKYLTEDYIDTLRNEKDQVRRQRLFMGDWEYDEDKDSLISFDALSDTFNNTIVKDNQKYMTVDVARLGQDSTVFTFWDGLELYRVERFQKQDTERTKQVLKDYAASEKIPFSNIIVDEDGIGGAVVDGLFGIKGFVANSTPLPTTSQIRGKLRQVESYLTPRTNFANLKAQCAYKLAELIQERKVAFRAVEYRNEIIEDLTALLRAKSIDTDSKMAIKSKQDVKIDIGHSPDIGDAIIFRAYFELKRDATIEDPNRANHVLQQQSRFEMNRANFLNRSNK